ncbi:hypothetical protein ATE92_2264 [Ulvibacter sp. MAR_2010_11]|uniref:hypothetical protein n=1 Tax=Ulvibacter sp. MAR_2010_11 TaxID=1250229 RepID=UPI000C2B67F8|nr:hypothetical protein [Ulvibacter sp. MAR_2010_11]PKA84094.1 hypothetical protein ATE92_2264 [Ulvibacter sp. MAR_2010_11]
MKNYISLALCIGFILSFVTLNAQSSAQVVSSNSEYTIIHANDLKDITNGNTRGGGFPWEGCREFTVTIDVEIFSIETTVLLCCVQGVCIPNVTGGSEIENRSSNRVYVKNSSSLQVGNFTIRILEGYYNLNNDNEITNLTYEITKTR